MLFPYFLASRVGKRERILCSVEGLVLRHCWYSFILWDLLLMGWRFVHVFSMRIKVISLLDSELPFGIIARRISSEEYWERVCRARWSSGQLLPSRSWKQVFFFSHSGFQGRPVVLLATHPMIPFDNDCWAMKSGKSHSFLVWLLLFSSLVIPISYSWRNMFRISLRTLDL